MTGRDNSGLTVDDYSLPGVYSWNYSLPRLFPFFFGIIIQPLPVVKTVTVLQKYMENTILGKHLEVADAAKLLA